MGKGGILQDRLWNTMIHFYKVDFCFCLVVCACAPTLVCACFCVCVCARALCMQPHACRSLDLKVKGQLLGAGSRLPPQDPDMGLRP